MNKLSILVPVDFSEASDKAILYGISLAKKMDCGISLLHVFEDEGMSLNACESRLKEIADGISNSNGLPCDCLCEKGNIFNVIPSVSGNGNFRLMVIATHGARGFWQKVFGPDILKLLRKISIPALVVQKDSILSDDGFSSAVLPVGSHDEYDRLVDGMTMIAGLFDPEIHLYSIVKPGFEQTDKLKQNIKKAENSFSEKGIRFKRVAEDQRVFSVGFAKQTLKYAEENGSEIIAIMSNATKENYYFADSDKIAILTNKQNIPVLCASDVEPRL
jgi:universal stress protein A